MVELKVHDEVMALVHPLALEKSTRISEFKKRNKRIFQKRVLAVQADELIKEKGWEHRKKLPKGRVLLEKQKSHDEILENRIWGILYHLGFDELNEGRKFCINVTAEGEKLQKQVDVYAKTDDIIVIVECKSSQKKQARSLQKDIGEFASLRKPIANTLRKKYGGDQKLKILWLFATSNIIWTQQDRLRASEQNIQIVEDRELRYFEEIAKNIGPAARYQFLAEFLASQRISSLSDEPIPAIRTKLGGQWVYSFVAPAERMIPISFVNHRALRDLDGAPSYQRVLKRARLKEIGKYIDGGGYFANNVIVNFKDRIRFDKKFSYDGSHISIGELYLPDKFKSVWVIDGQHRLFGFTEGDDKAGKKVLPILAFDRLPAKSEADLFAVINGKQQKVARGLLDELAGELKMDSLDFNERIGAIASRCLDMLAAETGNPFEDRIKTADLGDSDVICLTISSIKNEIVSSKLLGHKPRKDLEFPGAFSRSKTKNTIEDLCVGLTNYFSIIRGANPDRWERGRPGLVCHNVGIQGYLRLLAALIEFLEAKTKQNANSLEPEELIEQISKFLTPVVEFLESAEDSEFAEKFKQPFGSGGPPRYFYQLCLLVQKQFPDFKPDGLDDYLLETKSSAVQKAHDLTRTLVERIHSHVVSVLKVNYEVDFFDKGIPQKEIRVEAFKKRVEADNSLPLETYLDVIDLKKIIEHRQNWELFKTTMNIQMVDEQKGQAKYLKWLEKLNEVRRIPAHPFGRTFSSDEIDFLEFLDEQLLSRGV